MITVVKNTDDIEWVLYKDYTKLESENTTLLARIAELEGLLKTLLCYVNPVTCDYRHGHSVSAISKRHINELVDKQIEIEKAITEEATK